MNAFRAIFALIAFFGLVAVWPILSYFTTAEKYVGGIPTEMQFMLAFALPAILLLFLGGWIDTRWS